MACFTVRPQFTHLFVLDAMESRFVFRFLTAVGFALFGEHDRDGLFPVGDFVAGAALEAAGLELGHDICEGHDSYLICAI